MEKVLIIGAAGFVGEYLIDYLLKENTYSIIATKMQHEIIENSSITICDLDILNREEINNLLEKYRPTYIFHLAAQSSVALSWKNPALTIDVNIKGSINLLETVHNLDYTPKILLIGSGEEYGYIQPLDLPVSENNVLRPGNIYAATKACQNMIGNIYADAYKMNIIMVRAFNHIGPNQSPIFVVADFCKQVAEIEKGLRAPILKVGNLKAKRDFTDVRDIVRAYTLLIQKGESGQTYNIGRGAAISIEEILEIILSFSSKRIEVEIDKNRFRPIDIPIIEPDISKITNTIGWKAIISIEQTIEDTLNYWRNKTEN